jgi:peptidoglycan pentaglycine glycine transferase (the first glycine)
MNRKEWNKRVIEHAPSFGGFLHSYEWGEFQRRLGRVVERVFVEDEKGVTMAQAVKMDLPFGQFYWYVPKGPLGTAPVEHQVEVLRQQLPDGLFLRLEPKDGGRMLQVRDMQPSHTTVLDLRKEELLASFKSKTRYNIRLSQRKGVVCKKVNRHRFDDFLRLLDQTTTRDQFSAHPPAYYQTMIETMTSEDARAYLAMAFYDDRPLAANVMIDFGGVRTYLHGASSNLHRNVMAPYGLHWFLIEDAKKRGFQQFDFWGVAPVDAGPKHTWAGITRYKMGFGGPVLEHPGTFDIPMKHLGYAAYSGLRRMRRLGRRS